MHYGRAIVIPGLRGEFSSCDHGLHRALVIILYQPLHLFRPFISYPIPPSVLARCLWQKRGHHLFTYKPLAGTGAFLAVVGTGLDGTAATIKE